MANNAAKTPLFRVISSRNYCCKPSSNANLNPICGKISQINTCTLPNKITVSSVDTGSPIARLSFVFKGGPRYESHDNLGSSHALRLAAGLSTKNCTSFAIVRNLQQLGANLTCTTDRETISYTLTGTQEAVRVGSLYLSEIVTNQAFKPWEVDEITPRMKLELACMIPEVRVMEMLHKAAYRSGLGNSLFSAKHRVGKYSAENLHHFARQLLSPENCAVVGLGLNADQLIEYAQNCEFSNNSPLEGGKSKYYGGVENRKEKGGHLAYVALATEGGNLNDAITFEVLKNALGTGPRVQAGTAANPLAKIQSKAAENEPSAVSAFSASYTDSGLFGIMIVSGVCSANSLVSSAATLLKDMKLDAKDIARGKKQTLVDGLLRLEAGDTCVASIGKQALLGCPMTPNEFMSAVEKVSDEDVKKAAQKIASGKLTMASYGNLSTVPYLDQLK